MKTITIRQAQTVVGGLSQVSKMPCPSFSLPTAACHTGAKMAQVKGSICSDCYATKGLYRKFANTVEPKQVARLGEVLRACEDAEFADVWVESMVVLVKRHLHFRWHDSGDLQSVRHLELIARVVRATPRTSHWLPTRDYGMVKDWVAAGSEIPPNLVIRLSAMYPDKPVKVPKSLQGVSGIAVSLVHSPGATPMASACPAPEQGGACGSCRTCWTTESVSYVKH